MSFRPIWSRTFSDAEIFRETRELAEALREAAPVWANDTPSKQKRRRERAEADPQTWNRTYLPHYFSEKPPKLHKVWYEKMAEAEQSRKMLLLCTPRGHAKTTVATFADPLRLAVTGERKFQIIISKTSTHATAVTASIKTELEHNPRILHDYGEQKSNGLWADDYFATQSGCAILARGYGQQVRGIKHREHRPDGINVDDIDDKRTAKNPSLTREIFETLKDTYFPALDPKRRRFIFVSNKFATDCVMARCLEDADGRYLKQVDKAIAKPRWDGQQHKFVGGKPLWPEYFSLDMLSEIRQTVGEKVFEAEYQNNPDDSAKLFPAQHIHRYDPNLMTDPLFYFLAIDPSAKDTGDFKAQVLVGTNGRKRYVRHARVRRESINQMIGATFSLFERFAPLKVGLEAEGLQELFWPIYHAVSNGQNEDIGFGRWSGVYLPLIPITQRGISKDSTARIGGLAPDAENGALLFAEGPDAGDMDLLIEQLKAFPERQVEDDGPDALEMAVRLSREVTGLVPEYRTVVRGRWPQDVSDGKDGPLSRDLPPGRYAPRRGIY